MKNQLVPEENDPSLEIGYGSEIENEEDNLTQEKDRYDFWEEWSQDSL